MPSLDLVSRGLLDMQAGVEPKRLDDKGSGLATQAAGRKAATGRANGDLMSQAGPSIQ